MVNSWRFWLALAVSVLLILLLAYQVDLGEIRSSLSDANYLFLAPAIALYFVTFYFRAVRWRFLLSPLRLIPARRLYPVIVIGQMSNNVLPARLGELVRSYYLARREQFNTSTALATVAVERVFDGVTLLIFAGLSGPALLVLGWFSSSSEISRTVWMTVATVTVALFFGALFFLTCLVAIPRFVDFVEKVTRLVPGRYRTIVRELIQTFVQGLRILGSPRQHLMLFLLSVPVWIFEGGTYLLIGYSFGIDQLFGSVWVLVLVVMLLLATSNLATALPIAIGGIGPFEVVATQTLLALAVDGSLAAAYVGFLHLIALWLPVNVVGLGLVWRQNCSIKLLLKSRPPNDS